MPLTQRMERYETDQYLGKTELTFLPNDCLSPAVHLTISNTMEPWLCDHYWVGPKVVT